MSQAKRYNYCLDFIKGIACICVVLMHCEFPGLLGVITQTTSRFCVPFFFMVSGYFCFFRNEGENAHVIKKKILHILRITIYASLFYVCFVLLQQYLWHDQIFNINRSRLLFFLLFNQPFVIAGQYWFLFALTYTYICYFIIDKLNISKFAYYVAGIIFIVYFSLAQGAHIIGIDIPNYIYRNWLIEGFSYFMLGHFIHSYQDKINLSNRTLLWIIVLSTLLCIPERFLLGRDFGVNISTVPQVFALFFYAMKNPNKNAGIIQLIGKDCSMLIYVLHPFVWHTLERSYDMLKISSNIFALYSMPIMVIIITLLISLGLNLLTRLLQSRRHVFQI